MKIPAPIMAPVTIMAASKVPRVRFTLSLLSVHHIFFPGPNQSAIAPPPFSPEAVSHTILPEEEPMNKAVRILVVVSIAASLIPAAAQAQTVQQVLDKLIEAQGGRAALAALKNR